MTIVCKECHKEGLKTPSLSTASWRHLEQEGWLYLGRAFHMAPAGRKDFYICGECAKKNNRV